MPSRKKEKKKSTKKVKEDKPLNTQKGNIISDDVRNFEPIPPQDRDRVEAPPPPPGE